MKKKLYALTALLCIFAFQNCSEVNFADLSLSNGFGFPKFPGDSFGQTYLVNGQANRVADILFVVDTSGSMRYEQTQIADRFDNLVSLMTDLDWRIAITTSNIRDRGEVGSNGQLIPFEGLGNTFYITKNTPNAQMHFSQTIQRQAGCVGSCDDYERGIYASNLLIDRRGQYGFFRSNAHLHIVIVSDENENSNGRDLELFDLPPTLTSRVQSILRPTSFTAHSIVTRPNDADCLFGEGENYGTVYAQLSDLTGGILGDVCADDYSAQLAEIGDVVIKKVNSLTMPCIPDPQTLTVNVQPALPSGVSYSVQLNLLVFSEPLEPGTTVAVNGVCAEDPFNEIGGGNP